MGENCRRQLTKKRGQAGASMVIHTIDFTYVGQPYFMAYVIGHAPARCGNHQVHELERRKARRVGHIDPPCHFSRKHSFSLVKGAIRSHFGCFSHGEKIIIFFSPVNS